MKKYNVGDKVKTIDTWNDGMGLVIPKGSIVVVKWDNGERCCCEWKNKEVLYEYEWLGEIIDLPIEIKFDKAEGLALSQELKPCPFCGGKAEFVTDANEYSQDIRTIIFYIECTNCRIKSPKRYAIRLFLGKSGQIEIDKDKRKDALKDWNRRSD